MENSSPRACPVTGCVLPIDIVLRSSDGVPFATHMKNLEQYSDGFPQTGSVEVNSDIPMLEETADVLELMLQFMHHTRQPDLSKIPFELLSSLAEAAEKYMIFSAMNVCKILMGLALKDHPVYVLIYAFKHDYRDLANAVAPLTMNMKAEVVIANAKASRIGDSFLAAWFCYRENRAEIGRSLLQNQPGYGIGGLHKGGVEQCDLWTEFFKEVISRSVWLNFTDPTEIERILLTYIDTLDDCSHCSKRGRHRLAQVEKTFKQGLPLFVSL